MRQSVGTESGYTSISFTTQSASRPVVLATSLATTLPAMERSSVSGAVTQLITSGRLVTKRWSSASQWRQREPRLSYVCSIGRARYGTGCAGSLTQVSPASSCTAGGSKVSRPSSCRYSDRGVAFALGGHDSKRRHRLAPPSNIVASAMESDPLSLSQKANQGACTLARNQSPASLPKSTWPSRRPGPAQPPWLHGPITIQLRRSVSRASRVA